MRRIGWSLGTRFSGSITTSIARCRRSSPRMRLSSSAPITHFDELCRSEIQAFINSLLSLPP